MSKTFKNFWTFVCKFVQVEIFSYTARGMSYINSRNIQSFIHCTFTSTCCVQSDNNNNQMVCNLITLKVSEKNLKTRTVVIIAYLNVVEMDCNLSSMTAMTWGTAPRRLTCLCLPIFVPHHLKLVLMNVSCRIVDVVWHACFDIEHLLLHFLNFCCYIFQFLDQEPIG